MGHHGRFWFSCTKGCGKSFKSREFCDEHSKACMTCERCKFHIKQCQCCPRCGSYPCQCCPRCGQYPCRCCSRCLHYPCRCPPAPRLAPPAAPPPAPEPEVKPAEPKKKKKSKIKGSIKSNHPVISLAPSPFTFYKPTTKFDNEPRVARADGDTWGDLERAVQLGEFDDEPERDETIKVKDFKKGMFDEKHKAKDMNMSATLQSPKESPNNSPKLKPRA